MSTHVVIVQTIQHAADFYFNAKFANSVCSLAALFQLTSSIQINVKSILIQPENEQQFELLQAFIQQHKLKAFLVPEKDNEINSASLFDDAIRIFIPIL